MRIVNIAIAALVVLAAFAAYWFAFRPLPQTTGSILAPIENPATIRRDARGIPHIEAANWQDAIFLQGYATAQDRLWQMDGLRRFGAGELSEVFGAATIAQDTNARKMRLRPLAEAAAAALSPEQRAVFVAYAQGVNYYIRTHRGRYSLEFSLPGHTYDPKPWTVVDSLLIGMTMFRDQTDTRTLDATRGELYEAAKDLAKMRLLYPPQQGNMVAPGSNAWAVSGTHTASGKPMLANDPHLSYGIPPTWYLVHIKAPDLNVTGASLPGVPGVLTGHNDHIAWGFTSLLADCMDLYRERMDLHTGRYFYNGNWEQARLETEVVGVAGAKPVSVQTWITRHGPVIATDSHGNPLSLRWTANDGVTFPFWDIDRARDWPHFRAAAKALTGPGLNFVYADAQGNIGYQAAGRVPIRNGFDGAAPADGTSAAAEWQGYIPADQMPSAYNPAAGIIASGNQNPFPSTLPFPVSGGFHGRYRVRQIQALLAAKSKLDVPAMLAIQKDVYSAFDHFLAIQTVAAVNKAASKDPLTQEAIGLLRKWDGQMDKNDAAPVITQLLFESLAQDLVLANLKNTGKLISGPGAKQQLTIKPRPEVIEDLLRMRPNGWVARDDWDAWLVANLTTAIAQGREGQGTPLSKWRWGHLLQWNFQHPVGKQLPLVSGYFDIGPIEMSGSSTTIKQTTATLGPSERMVVEFGNLDTSVQNLTTGESGAVASAHYKDQWPGYYVGSSQPMEFQYVTAKETLHIRPASGFK